MVMVERSLCIGGPLDNQYEHDHGGCPWFKVADWSSLKQYPAIEFDTASVSEPMVPTYTYEKRTFYLHDKPLHFWKEEGVSEDYFDWRVLEILAA